MAAQALELKKRMLSGKHIPSWADYKIYKAADAIKGALGSTYSMKDHIQGDTKASMAVVKLAYKKPSVISAVFSPETLMGGLVGGMAGNVVDDGVRIGKMVSTYRKGHKKGTVTKKEMDGLRDYARQRKMSPQQEHFFLQQAINFKRKKVDRVTEDKIDQIYNKRGKGRAIGGALGALAGGVSNYASQAKRFKENEAMKRKIRDIGTGALAAGTTATVGAGALGTGIYLKNKKK
tara:strand:- start:328 stop:1029 length:702 start_codon:yes stop_codon:yes gene_type:complete